MTGRPVRALGLAALMVLAALPAPLSANDLDEELQRVSERIDEIASIIDDIAVARSSIAAEIKEAAAELEELRAELDASEAALGEARTGVETQERRLQEVRSVLRDAYADLSETEAAIAAERVAAIQTARSAYISGRRDPGVLTIATEQISMVAVGLEYLARVSEAHSHSLAAFAVLKSREEAQRDSIAQDEAALARDLAELETFEAGLGVVHADYLARRAELETALAVQARLLETLDEEIAHFERELEGLQAEQGGIRRRIAREQAAAEAERVSSVSPGSFVRPVAGAVTSGFGPRYHPVLGYSRPHTGIDMRAKHGEPIRAAQDGVVILANVWGGYGRTVVIDHGSGLSTLYAHLSSLAVSYGDQIGAGTVVGRVGTSGLSTGAHLHFEVRLTGDPVDPASYLGG